MTNEMSGQRRREVLRELVIVTGFVAMLVTGVGSLYWMQPRTEAAPAAPPAAGVIHADVYFDFKSVRLRADAARILQEKAAGMTGTETWSVLVMGYADRQGPAAYNRTLALHRAEVVKQFLVELGVPEASVKVVAVGPEAVVCDDPGKECQQLNRRVHLEIRRFGPVALAPITAKQQHVAAP